MTVGELREKLRNASDDAILDVYSNEDSFDIFEVYESENGEAVCVYLKHKEVDN